MGRATGEEDSFRAAFVELWPAARRVARRMLANPAVADDVAAEAMARAFARWNRIEHLPYRDAWVMRVTTNLALDTLRRRPPPVTTAEPDYLEDAAAVRLALAAALRKLPGRQREVVVLRYLADYTEDDVAATLGIAPGSVRTHMHRGLQTLRRQLGDDFPGVSLAV
jgi:RNA polymerase sigma-70 factor, ECF subfamily